MIKKLLISLLVCGLAFAVDARPGPDSNYNIAISGGGGGYTGPGDITTFSLWVGLRSYSNAKLGTHVISLCDNVGANCADVSTNATTGVLNSPGTRGAVNCNTATTCIIATFYDQTAGGNNCTGGTATLNMTGGPGGTTPAAIFNGASHYSCTAAAQAQPVSLSTVAETSTTSGFLTVISYGGQAEIGFGSSSGNAYIYAGGSADTATATISTWHAMQGLINNPGGATASALYIDGTNTPTSSSPGSGAPAGSATTVGTGIGGTFTGSMSEAGTIASNASSNFSALNSNQHSFWGF